MTNRIIMLMTVLLAASGINAYVLKAERSVVEGNLIYLSGGIVLTSDDYTCTGDTAVFSRNDSMLFMPEKIRIVNRDSLVIDALSGIYNVRNKSFLLYSQYSVKQDEWNIKSDTLLLMVSDSIGNYSGNVDAYLNGPGYRIECDSMRHLMKDSLLTAWHNPVMTGDSSEFSTYADTFLLMLSDSVYSFFRNVQIQGDSFTIQSDSFVFYDAGRLGRNYYRAVLFNDTVHIESDSLTIFSEHGKADSVLLEYDVQFRHDGGKEQNSIDCNKMFITFSNSAFERMDFYDIIKAYMNIKREADGTEN